MLNPELAHKVQLIRPNIHQVFDLHLYQFGFKTHETWNQFPGDPCGSCEHGYPQKCQRANCDGYLHAEPLPEPLEACTKGWSWLYLRCNITECSRKVVVYRKE